MKKAKKRKEKLKKTRNKINPLSQKDFEDNNISILFSSFNILKSNKMEEKAPNFNSQNKIENGQKYKDSMFSIYFNNSLNENEDKKEEKRRKKKKKRVMVQKSVLVPGRRPENCKVGRYLV